MNSSWRKIGFPAIFIQAILAVSNVKLEENTMSIYPPKQYFQSPSYTNSVLLHFMIYNRFPNLLEDPSLTHEHQTKENPVQFSPIYLPLKQGDNTGKDSSGECSPNKTE